MGTNSYCGCAHYGNNVEAVGNPIKIFKTGLVLLFVLFFLGGERVSLLQVCS